MKDITRGEGRDFTLEGRTVRVDFPDGLDIGFRDVPHVVEIDFLEDAEGRPVGSRVEVGYPTDAEGGRGGFVALVTGVRRYETDLVEDLLSQLGFDTASIPYWSPAGGGARLARVFPAIPVTSEEGA